MEKTSLFSHLWGSSPALKIPPFNSKAVLPSLSSSANQHRNVWSNKWIRQPQLTAAVVAVSHQPLWPRASLSCCWRPSTKPPDSAECEQADRNMGQIRLQFIHISYCISSLIDTVTLPKESQRTIQASSKLIYCLEVLHQALLHKGHRRECFLESHIEVKTVCCQLMWL